MGKYFLIVGFVSLVLNSAHAATCSIAGAMSSSGSALQFCDGSIQQTIVGGVSGSCTDKGRTSITATDFLFCDGSKLWTLKGPSAGSCTQTGLLSWNGSSPTICLSNTAYSLVTASQSISAAFQAAFKRAAISAEKAHWLSYFATYPTSYGNVLSIIKNMNSSTTSCGTVPSATASNAATATLTNIPKNAAYLVPIEIDEAKVNSPSYLDSKAQDHPYEVGAFCAQVRASLDDSAWMYLTVNPMNLGSGYPDVSVPPKSLFLNLLASHIDDQSMWDRACNRLPVEARTNCAAYTSAAPSSLTAAYELSDYQVRSTASVLRSVGLLTPVTNPEPGTYTSNFIKSYRVIYAASRVHCEDVTRPLPGYSFYPANCEALRAKYPDIASTEYTFWPLGTKPAPTSAYCISDSDAQEMAEGIYQNILGRAPNGSELTSSIKAFRGGKTASELRAQIAGSAEAKTQAAKLYRAALFREPSSADVASIVDLLRDGGSPDSLGTLFGFSSCGVAP